MNTSVASMNELEERQDWTDIARQLAQEFGHRASAYDDEGRFVEQNYADLRDCKLFSAGIPAELSSHPGGSGEPGDVFLDRQPGFSHFHTPSDGCARVEGALGWVQRAAGVGGIRRPQRRDTAIGRLRE